MPSVGCMIINPWLNQGRSWPLLAGVHYIHSNFARWKFTCSCHLIMVGVFSLHRAPPVNVPIRRTLPFVVIILANDANEICSDSEIVSSLPGIKHWASGIRGKYTNHWGHLLLMLQAPGSIPGRVIKSVNKHAPLASFAGMNVTKCISLITSKLDHLTFPPCTLSHLFRGM